MNVRFGILPMVVLVVSACGGGGGSEETLPSPTPTSQPSPSPSPTPTPTPAAQSSAGDLLSKVTGASLVTSAGDPPAATTSNPSPSFDVIFDKIYGRSNEAVSVGFKGVADVSLSRLFFKVTGSDTFTEANFTATKIDSTLEFDLVLPESFEGNLFDLELSAEDSSGAIFQINTVNAQGVAPQSFANFFPSDSSTFGRHNFSRTHFTDVPALQEFPARDVEFIQEIIGTETVPYQSGARTGLVITNLFDEGAEGTLEIDGDTVRFLAAGGEVFGGPVFFADDASLVDPAQAWTFGLITSSDPQPRQDYFIIDKNDLATSELVASDGNSMALFADVTVTQGSYERAVVIWNLDRDLPYVPLDLAGVDERLGLRLPNAENTGGSAVTAFQIYAEGVFQILEADVDAASGAIVGVWELESIN